MQCDDCQAQLIDLHYQELEPQDHQAVCLHLCGCPACSAEYRALHADLQGLRASVSAPPRPALQAKIRAAALPPRPVGPLQWLRGLLSQPVPVYGVAAVAGALLLVLLWAWPRTAGRSGQAPSAGGERGPAVAAPARPALPSSSLRYDSRELIAVDPSLL